MISIRRTVCDLMLQHSNVNTQIQANIHQTSIRPTKKVCVWRPNERTLHNRKWRPPMLKSQTTHTRTHNTNTFTHTYRYRYEHVRSHLVHTIQQTEYRLMDSHRWREIVNSANTNHIYSLWIEMIEIFDHHLAQNLLFPSQDWELVQWHHIRLHGHRRNVYIVFRVCLSDESCTAINCCCFFWLWCCCCCRRCWWAQPSVRKSHTHTLLEATHTKTRRRFMWALLIRGW